MADETFLKPQADGGFRVNFNDVEEAKFELIPKGEYDVVVEEAEYKLSQSSNQPMWALTLTIEGGEYDGRKLFNNVSFSEKALPFAKRTLAKCWPHLLTTDFNPEAIDDYGIQGWRGRVKVKHRDYEGEKQANVGDMFQRGASGGAGGNAFMTS
ncbi:MAG: DUF669 domain-containing protein [Nitrospira sp.]